MNLLIMIGISCFWITQISAQISDTLWTKTFGTENHDRGYEVKQTSDGGYIIAGLTDSFGRGLDYLLIRTDELGTLMWFNAYGGTEWDESFSVQETNDGGFIIAGHSMSFGAGKFDIWLVKTDTEGDTLWTKTFGGSSNDFGTSVIQSTDGGYILLGHTWSFGNASDIWLIKTDSSGNELWSKRYGGSLPDQSNSVQQTEDGGYVIVGYTESFGAGSGDIWLIKTDDTGDTLWTKTFGGSEWEEADYVQQTSDGGYIIVGEISSFGAGKNDIWLIKTDESGDSLWSKTIGGTNFEEAHSVLQTSDGGYIIVGETRSHGAGLYDVWVVRTNASGDLLWHKPLGGADHDQGHSIAKTNDGGFVVVGYTASYGAGGDDVWLIKFDIEKVGIEETVEGKILNFSLSQNYPNPFNPTTIINYSIPVKQNVRLTVFDLKGREVYRLVQNELPAGRYYLKWDASGLPSGMYLYKIQAGDLVITKKMLLIR